jgi:hypothetical protein
VTTRLQALDVTPVSSNADGRKSDDNTASPLLAAAVVNAGVVAKVDENADRHVGGYQNVDGIRSATAESGHADTRQSTALGGGSDVPHGREVSSRCGSHLAPMQQAAGPSIRPIRHFEHKTRLTISHPNHKGTARQAHPRLTDQRRRRAPLSSPQLRNRRNPIRRGPRDLQPRRSGIAFGCT